VTFGRVVFGHASEQTYNIAFYIGSEVINNLATEQRRNVYPPTVQPPHSFSTQA